jgi:hypothetical protein
MFRQLVTIILLVCALSGTLHAGEEQTASMASAQAECSFLAGCGTAAHPCPDGADGGCQEGHCCGAHLHLQAISGSQYEFSHFSAKKQFIALMPHFFPSDHLQERFIPPRRTV